jgi:hypothetical protein
MVVLNMENKRKGQGEGTRGGNRSNGTHLMPPLGFDSTNSQNAAIHLHNSMRKKMHVHEIMQTAVTIFRA